MEYFLISDGAWNEAIKPRMFVVTCKALDDNDAVTTSLGSTGHSSMTLGVGDFIG